MTPSSVHRQRARTPIGLSRNLPLSLCLDKCLEVTGQIIGINAQNLIMDEIYFKVGPNSMINYLIGPMANPRSMSSEHLVGYINVLFQIHVSS